MSFDFSTLITDRTQADVSALSALMSKKLETWTDEEREKFNNGLLKGGYWWTDLNRVTACMEYINRELQDLGYETGYKPVVVHEEPGPVYDENTILLLHGEDLTDSSKHSAQLSNFGVQISSSESKFGGKSLFFDGKSHLTVKTGDIGFNLNSNWTIDWWEYATSDPGVTSAVFCIPDGSYGFITGSPLNGKVRIFAGGSAGWTFIPVTECGNFIQNSWVHRAICKNGNSIKAFEHGKLYAEITTGGSIQTKETLYIGQRATTSNSGWFSGYLDEIRISNVARWDSEFTPPELPYGSTIEQEPEPLDPYTWYKEDSPTMSQMEQYLANVAALRSVFELPEYAPQTPQSMALMTFAKANDIESILEYVETTIQQTVKGMARSNSFTFWSGNRPFPTADSNKGRNWKDLDAMNTGWRNWQMATWYLLLYGNLKAEGAVV